MIPLYLRISGFLSYREPVDLDFSLFDLACISGQNGAGKSSLLDAITWALFGQARRRDDALINAHSNAAEVILDFSYEGNVFRVQRAKPRDKAVLLEFFIHSHPETYQPSADANPGAWKPLTERSVRETEARVAQTLRMDYDTFTNASFFLQGKADQFSQQRPGDRKRILSSILGLEVWETYRVEASERRKVLEVECQKIDGRLHEIQSELNEESTRQAHLKELEQELERLTQARAVQEAALENLRRLADSLAQQRDLVNTLEQQLHNVRQNLDAQQNRLNARRSERENFAAHLAHAAQIEAAYQAWQAARQSLEGWEAIATRFREQEKRRLEPLQAIENARTRLRMEAQNLSAQKTTVDGEQALLQEMNAQMAAVEAEMTRLQAQIEQREHLENALRDLHQQQADARAENPRLKAEMDELKGRIDPLNLDQQAATCPLCGQPLSPEERHSLIERLEAQGKTLGDRYRKNQDLLKEFEQRSQALTQELAALQPAENELRAYGRQLAGMQARVQQILQKQSEWEQNGALRLREVEAALQEESFALDARAELAAIDAELKAMGYDAAAHDAARQAEQEGRSAEAELRALEAARAALEPLEREIAGLEEQVNALAADDARQQQSYEQAASAYAAASAQAPDVDRAEDAVMRLRSQENHLRMEVGAARQNVLVLDDLRTRQAGLSAQREDLNQQIARYKTLERAFGKDGVPALLIEQALPEIESQTNEFLERLSGGSMSVSFVTQREYKDKNRADLRETLDIRISDESGMRDYEMFSGGEAFRVNFAIRLALSKVLAQRAGARLQTLVIDEGFGSQDAQGRQRLVEAIHLVRADFAKILVITHLDELKDVFPNRIEVEKTSSGSTLHVI